MRWRSLISLALVSLILACSSARPPVIIRPPVPTTYTLFVHVCDGTPCEPGNEPHKRPGAEVTTEKDGTTYVAHADGAGNLIARDLVAGPRKICASDPGYKPACADVTLPRAEGQDVFLLLKRDVPPVQPLRADGRIFRTADGQAWRWKGVSAFKLLRLFELGGDAAIDPFLEAYRGFNVLRVWLYVEWPAPTGWEPPSVDTTRAFLDYVGARGWYVELTLLTSDGPQRLAWARGYLAGLAVGPPANLLIEIGNEPETNKRIDTAALIPQLDATSLLYATGNYEDSTKMRGRYGVTHTARTRDWSRRSHDLLEFYQGGGPNDANDPPHRMPIVADEPAKPQDIPGGMAEADVLAYFGGAALMGAGATWHCESCKYARVPDANEARLAARALEAMNAFSADAPLGGYRRIVEAGQPGEARTYVIGNYMVRSQQNGTNAPESGWTAIDSGGVLWRR